MPTPAQAKFFINVTGKVKESDNVIISRIKEAMGKELALAVRSSFPALIPKLEELVYFWVEQQPEIESLRGGLLQGDFGIPKSMAFTVTQEIIYAVSKSVDLVFTGFDKKLMGKLTINIQPTTFENVLSVAAPVVTEKGTVLPWLKWLLFSGDQIMVRDYHVEYLSGEDAGRSRSGTGAVMAPEGLFRVRPEFAGTSENNFISRALERRASQIGRLLEEHISAKMGR
tara:strand:+ start:667 stop:1347 length:681 start_codon:yes stop_codon:yes gene_type:complete